VLGQGASTTFSQNRIPAWNTPGRPEKAKLGTMGFNIQTESLEYWDGKNWLKLPMKKIL
jgi:hypothetical protein